MQRLAPLALREKTGRDDVADVEHACYTFLYGSGIALTGIHTDGGDMKAIVR